MEFINLLVLFVIALVIFYFMNGSDEYEHMNGEQEVISDTALPDAVVPDEKDEQLEIMQNAKNKYLPDDNQIAVADISKADAELIKIKNNENGFIENEWNTVHGMDTISQSRRHMSRDIRGQPNVEKTPESTRMFTYTSVEPDPFTNSRLTAINACGGF